MSLRRRLERLEGGTARRCPECALRPDEVPEIVVELPTGPPEEPPRETGSVRCQGCGRYLVIDWDDAPTTPGELARLEAEMLARGRGVLGPWPPEEGGG